MKTPTSATVDDLAQALTEGAVVIDVREPWEYEQARVPGARLIPLASLPTRRDELPAGEAVWLICASGNRSASAADFLAMFGHDTVNVMGGTSAWMRSGRPLEQGAAS